MLFALSIYLWLTIFIDDIYIINFLSCISLKIIVFIYKEYFTTVLKNQIYNQSLLISYNKIKQIIVGFGIFWCITLLLFILNISNVTCKEITLNCFCWLDALLFFNKLKIINDNKYKRTLYLCNEENISHDSCESCKCSICFETMHENIVIKLLCNHLFHKNCIINKWIIKCPLCRKEI